MSVLERLKQNREWDEKRNKPDPERTIEQAVDMFLTHLALALEEVLLFDVHIRTYLHPYCITLEFFKDVECKQHRIGKLEYRPCYPDPNVFPAVNVCPYLQGGANRYGNLVSLQRVESWLADMLHKHGVMERTELTSAILEDGVFKDRFFNYLRLRDSMASTQIKTQGLKFLSWIYPRK